MATDQFDGWLARRHGRTTPLGSLLDPVADKVLVLAAMIVLIDENIFPGWMVAAIVAREILVSGLRLAAVERGVVISARDLGKVKTWAQAVAVAVGGFAAAGAWDQTGRVVGAAGRGRADLGLRAGLRARRPGPPARPRDRLGAALEAVCSFGLDGLAQACGPPLGLLGLAVELGKRPEDRLALLRGRLRPDLRAHRRLTLKERRPVGRWRRG